MIPFDGYSWDAESNLFSRQGFGGIRYSDGTEAERRIQLAVERASDRGTFSRELLPAITDWPSEYHLSRQRHCLVRPLGIKPGDEVLELGCGCGAVTRYLGELGAEVTAVEGSRVRASIAAERCRDLPNVRVVADDILNFHSSSRFKWVLLIGVLEYAAMFSDAPDPVGHYLQSAKGSLDSKGRLVIAIENKLGLKYFNALAEDHIGIPFFGIQGLYGPKTQRTFGRRELEAHIQAAGLMHRAFYYPFPDYKLPQVILSEQALSDSSLNAADLLATFSPRDYSGCFHRLFDNALAVAEVANNGLLADLSNSFLVVAATSPFKPSADAGLAQTFSAQRVKEFATETRFVRSGDRIRVVKHALNPGLVRRASLRDGRVLENVLDDDADYVSGRLLVRRVSLARARAGALEQITEAFEPWFEFILRQAVSRVSANDSANQKGERLSDLFLSSRSLDLTPFNLIETDGGIVAIDNEWRIDGDIPLGWVATRSVLHCLGRNPGFEVSAIGIAETVKALCSKRGLVVDDSEIATWLDLESQFQTAVSGTLAQEFPLTSTSLIPLHRLAVEQEHQIAGLQQILTGQQATVMAATKARDKIAKLTETLTNREQTLASMKSSLSWRITMPLRWFAAVYRLWRGGAGGSA